MDIFTLKKDNREVDKNKTIVDDESCCLIDIQKHFLNGGIINWRWGGNGWGMKLTRHCVIQKTGRHPSYKHVGAQ